MPQVNILVAEDFDRFRDFACRELQRRPEFRVVAVSDGLAAVQKAEELRPDLILLDIGLPALNGLAAAQRIRSISPESRIVFLTQESSPEVVHEALKLGSQGYISKTRARYLLPAVEAILEGGQATGSGLPARVPGCRGDHGHQAQFYSDDRTFLEAAERFLGSALIADDGAIAIATHSHLRQLLQRLRNWGTNVDRAIEQGSFVQLDADELIARILSDGVAHCQPSLVETIESAATATMRPRPRVAVFGEAAGILWAAGHVDTAIGLEQLGVEIVRTMSVDIMCAYPLIPVHHDGGFKTVCRHHGAVIIR